ncbi:cytochrome c biogenesis protein CcdA [Pseudanabaena sp. FACHB-1277]|jgi:cytochrome c-type biogenesis protein|uniref:Cytochrome c biogenesis protein CcdA n=2 Tax=Pseudanabaena TaxID=1152 RepID=A0A926UW69_9CYAN|nr:cytochrome c biogenesis protein CcdA [Pseudanabaena cinerea]MBD2152342.1 cytochrome c biogenesis protein CcdA [Pseudanabaena cinerea FACHB-1277]
MKPLQDSDRETDLAMPTTTNNSPKIPKKWFVFGGLALLGFGLALFITAPISQALEYAISVVENRYQEWFAQQDTANPLVLMPLAFFGGLIASVSPCILAMLPLNLSYIGTRNITSRKDALIKAGMFVLGNVIILSLFGLVSSFAGLVIVEYRGHINVVVGTIILIMGLGLLGLIKIPLPQIYFDGNNFGPFGIGLTYALVSSPCASPVLFAVLAASAASGSQVLSILTMVSYALGYTIVIFLSSLLTGFAKQANLLLKYSEGITKFGSVALVIAGIYYLFSGIQWFIGG